MVICFALSAIVFAFFVDPRVFLEGSPRAIALSAAFLGGMTLSFFGGLFWLGQRFCLDWCPSGVYFAVLGQNTMNGIEFAHPETCTECDVCDKVCPMDLKPRELSGGAYRGATGFYPQALSNFALCIRCGDCVVACEDVNVSRRDGPTSLRMGWLPEGARDAVDRTAETAPQPPAGTEMPAPEVRAATVDEREGER
jgi:polyferredoxin